MNRVNESAAWLLCLSNSGDERNASPALPATFVAWQGNFEDTVSKLLPLRYHLDAIGGSRTQQDVVHVTLLDAALRLPDQVRTSYSVGGGGKGHVQLW